MYLSMYQQHFYEQGPDAKQYGLNNESLKDKVRMLHLIF
jgi:hypothetical protein